MVAGQFDLDPLEVAIAGLRLILAGGVYRPLPIEAKVPGFEAVLNSCAGPLACPEGDEVNGIDRCLDRKSVIGLTPRERQVLAVLELGLARLPKENSSL